MRRRRPRPGMSRRDYQRLIAVAFVLGMTLGAGALQVLFLQHAGS